MSLVLARAEMARFSTLYVRRSERLLPARPPASMWRLDSYGDETILRIRAWRKGERVLDVGAGYSLLPRWLSNRFGVEVWVADDFGGEWRKHQNVERFISAEPAKYVMELVGKPEASSLPERYFDCVYSKLGVHFSPQPHANVWLHMERLVSDAPGSELNVIVGFGSVAERDPARAVDLIDEVTAKEERVIAGERSSAFWEDMHASGSLLSSSPFLYGAYVLDVLGARGLPPEEMRAARYLTDPDMLVDPWHIGLAKACFSRDLTEFTKLKFGRTFAATYCFKRQ